MRIGIDIDGVLYPWTDYANAAVMRQFGVPDPGEHLHWDHLLEQVGQERFGWLWTLDAAEEVFGWRGTYPGVAKAFGSILDSGHECHFVTHRNPALTGALTANFLEYHFGHKKWAGLHVLSRTPKHTVLEWDVFIDDKPDTVLDMLKHTDAKVFAPARPWNTRLVPFAGTRLIRYDDPSQVAEWVASQ